MAGRGKKTAAVAALVAMLGLGACTGGSDEAASGTDAPITTEAPVATDAPTTTAAVNELERDQHVNEFLDAVEANEACTSFECKTAEATYNRYEELYEVAGEIPGDDVLPYFDAISAVWQDWNDCLSTAESRFERFDCAEESGMEQAITDLADVVR